ncbi:MAG: efflux RND transporter permease subunit [Porticoccaceae bacterium]
MKRFNLSEWALSNRVLVVYLTLLLGALGVYSYFHLGQSEDPPFTFRMMVVNTQWPGATADEVDRLVTDRIEEKLQELDGLDYLRSYSRPGESRVFVLFREDLPPAAVSDGFYQVRKKIGDMRHRLPSFVAMLSTIALLGMVMRNSVILVDQIRQDLELGRARFDAIVEATVRRFRPIVLTALAAVLAMIPLTDSVFFGPMAVSIMGGLIAATGLTLIFVPALYAAWFRVPRRDVASAPAAVPAQP